MINITVYIECGCLLDVEATENGHKVDFDLKVVDYDNEEDDEGQS